MKESIMTPEERISRRLTQRIEEALFAQICGPVPQRRQTALRARGRNFETVELDDGGNVIEPLRCICGGMTVIHGPKCPFYCLTT